MAIFKPGSTLTQISGSVGGLMFRSREHFGSLSPSRLPAIGSPLRRNRPQGRLRELQSFWQSLTDAERDTWRNYADNIIELDFSPGNRVPSGIQRFQAANAILLGGGLSLRRSSPPAPSPLEAATPLDVRADLTSQEVVIRTIEGIEFILLQPQTFRFRASIPRRRPRSAFLKDGSIIGYAPEIDQFFPWATTPLRLSSNRVLSKGHPFWLTWQTATDNGAISPVSRTFVDVPEPGFVTAMRIRKQFGFPGFDTGGFFRVFPDATLRIWDSTDGARDFDLTSPGRVTLSSVRTWIQNVVGWEVRDFDSSRANRPATDLAIWSSPFLRINGNLGLLQTAE